MAKLKLYHLTPAENLEAIQRTGIVADTEGNIFAFTDMLVANEIAKNQVFTCRYAVLEIDRKGVVGRLRPDQVAEFSSGYHRIIRQAKIFPEFCQHVGTFDTNYDPTEYDYLRVERIFGRGREFAKRYLSIQAEFSVTNASAHAAGRDLSDEEVAEVNRQIQSLYDDNA